MNGKPAETTREEKPPTELALATCSGLSPTMQEVSDGMKNHGGEIHRYPGGYWRFHDATGRATPVSHGTSTVQALVRRGVAEYCEWKNNAVGLFPIKARLCDPNGRDDLTAHPAPDHK